MVRRSVFQLRCEADELAAWKSAAGFEPVSSWARRVLNEAAGSLVVAHSPGWDAGMAEVRRVAAQRESERAEREFRPDFGKRLGGKR